MLEGVDRQPAGFTIWTKKYRKEAHRNTEKKYTEIQLNRKRNYVKGVEVAGSPRNAQAAELARPRTIPALFRRNNCNNQLETFFKGSHEKFSTNSSTGSKPLTI